MKITFISASIGSGGAERSLVVLAKQLNDLGHDITIVTLNPSIPDVYEVPEGVERIQIKPGYKGTHPVKTPLFLFNLRRQLLALKAEAYISLVIHANIITMLAMLGTGKQVHVWNQSDFFHEPHPKWMINLAIKLFKRAKTVAFLDAGLARECAVKYGWNSIGISNPVDEVVFGGETYDLPGKYNIVGMGRLYSVKGFDKLINMFNQLKDDHPEWGLVILGDGELKQELQQKIIDLGLQNRVKMLGNIFPPFDLLKQCDIFAFTSLFEGQGMALIEAMVCGLASISFNCPTGPRNIIENEVNGLLIEDQNCDLFKEGLSKLMSDDDLREKLVVEGKKVGSKFTKQEIANQWLKAIRS